jgi:peptide/nickel transport system permease protein
VNRYTDWSRPSGLRRVRGWPAARTIAITYGITIVLAVTAAYLCSISGVLPHDPEALDLSAINALPSTEHTLGTDFVGRDLLARIMVGTQAFFLPGLLAVGVSLLFGGLLGVLIGFWPSRFGTPVGLLMQLLEALPKLVVVLLVIALFQPDIYLILLVVGITNIPATAELLRARIAVLRRKSYIEAALALGVHPAKVILKHVIWLHGRALVLVQATLGMGEAILIETALSYLGFGVQEPTPSWGNMVALGKDYFFRGEMWISTAPALAILLTILGFHLLGDALLGTRRMRGAVYGASCPCSRSTTCARTSISRSAVASFARSTESA